MKAPVNLSAALSRFDDVFRPRAVATLNDYKVMIVKVEGEFVWLAHPDTDDFLLVLDGHLRNPLREQDLELPATPNQVGSPRRSRRSRRSRH